MKKGQRMNKMKQNPLLDFIWHSIKKNHVSQSNMWMTFSCHYKEKKSIEVNEGAKKMHFKIVLF